MTDSGSLGALATMLARAMAPLDDAFRDIASFRSLMFTLGWNAKSLPPSYLEVANAALAATSALEALSDDPSLPEITALVGKAGDVYRAVRGLTEAPAGIDATAFLAEIGQRLVEYLLVEDLHRYAPKWFSLLESLGVIWFEHFPATDTRPLFTRVHIDWDQIPAVGADPTSILSKVYGWGTPTFDFAHLAELVSELINRLGVPTTVDRLGSDLATALQSGAVLPPVRPARRALTVVLFDTRVGDATDEVGVMLAELPSEGDTLPGMIAQLLVPDGITDTIDLGTGWTFQLRAGTDLAQQLGVVIRPDATFVRYPFAPGLQLPSAGFGITLAYAGKGPTLLFGQPGHTRLELASAQVGLEVDVVSGDLEMAASAGTTGLTLVLAAGDLDSFLGAMAGGGETRIAVPFTLAWSSRTGLSFIAGAGFAASLYPHADLGPLRFDRVDLAMRFVAGAGTTPELDVRAAVAFSGSIGPVAFSVDRAGIELAATFTDGNAGPFGLALNPLWPTGLGLAISAGPVSGGGFVSYDSGTGRYAGLLHLAVFDVTVTAIGILDTKDASGAALPPPGFSFLIVVSVDFPPIQLGLGFHLDGVGGVAALNRRLDANALVAAVRKGGLDAILFDPNPVKDAPTIIANLSSVFPVAMGRYVFGPMAIIGWGTPTLIHIELAVVVEVPAPDHARAAGTGVGGTARRGGPDRVPERGRDRRLRRGQTPTRRRRHAARLPGRRVRTRRRPRAARRLRRQLDVRRSRSAASTRTSPRRPASRRCSRSRSRSASRTTRGSRSRATSRSPPTHGSSEQRRSCTPRPAASTCTAGSASTRCCSCTRSPSNSTSPSACR